MSCSFRLPLGSPHRKGNINCSSAVHHTIRPKVGTVCHQQVVELCICIDTTTICIDRLGTAWQHPPSTMCNNSNRRLSHALFGACLIYLYMNSPQVLHCMEKGIIMRTPICFCGSRLSLGTFFGSKSGGKYLLSTLRSPMLNG